MVVRYHWMKGFVMKQQAQRGQVVCDEGLHHPRRIKSHTQQSRVTAAE
jgi:hypothetical protein